MSNNIELNVVALGNFNPLKAQIEALKAQIDALNRSLASKDIKLSSDQIKQYSSVMQNAIVNSHAFTVQTVQLSTAAQRLGERITKNNTTWRDFRYALKGVRDETSMYNKVGQRQVSLLQSIVEVNGNSVKVMTAHNANMKDATTRSMVYTEALKAQDAVLKQGATRIINWGKNTQWAGRQITAGLVMPILLVGTSMAKMYNEVDQNLTKLAKVYGVGLTEPTQQALNQIKADVISLGKELGASLGIATSEVTDIAQQFAAAGLMGKELLSATKQASRMVVLGEADKQQAINATISLQTAYKLNTMEVTEAVNFFNAAQAATSTSMADLIGAIPRVGPVIQGLGGSYKDMVAILTALKEGGVPAGEAANAIKTSMGRLINPTEAASERMKTFGVDIKSIVNDNAGDLIGTITALQSSLDKLNPLQKQQAIADLFGKFQFSRMSALMENFGRTGTQSAKVMEMMGMSAGQLATIADEQTKKIQQSASGRFKIAMESLKNYLIPVAQSALEAFTNLIEKVQHAAEVIAGLPGPLKEFIKLVGVGAIIGGPIIMLTGLLANFGGFLLKGMLNLRKFFMAIFGGGNTIKVLRDHFAELSAEEVVARNSSELFRKQQEQSMNAVTQMTEAIQMQIDVLKQLEMQYSGQNNATAQNINTTTSASGGVIPTGSYGLRPTYAGGIHIDEKKAKDAGLGVERLHILPGSKTKTDETRGAYRTISGDIVSTKSEYNNEGRNTVTGTMMAAAGARSASLNKQIGDKPFLAIREGEVATAEYAKVYDKIVQYAKDHKMSEQKTSLLLSEMIPTQEDLLAVESRTIAQRKAFSKLTDDEMKIFKGIVTSTKTNAEKQAEINGFFNGISGYAKEVESTYAVLMDEVNQGATYQERVDIATKRLAELREEEQTFRLDELSKAKMSVEKQRIAHFQMRAAAQMDVFSGDVSTPSAPIPFKTSVDKKERLGILSKSSDDISSSTRRFIAFENDAGNRIVAMVDAQGKVIASFNQASGKVTTSASNLKKAQTAVQSVYDQEAIELKQLNKARGRQIARIVQDIDMTRLTDVEQKKLITQLKRRTLAELEATTGATAAAQADLASSLTSSGGMLSNISGLFKTGKGNVGGLRGLGKGIGGVLKGSKGAAGGLGMAVALGGSMLSDALPESAPVKSTLSMASTGAGLGMMFGPQGALAGAAIGALIGGFQDLQKASEKASAGLRSTLGATKEEFESLGIKIEPLTSSLPSFNEKMDGAKDAVDRFKQSIESAADTSEQKQFVEKLKGAGSDQAKIDDLVAQKARALALGGAKQADIMVAVKAYMESANLTRTNFDVASLFDKGGKLKSSVASDTVKGAMGSLGVDASAQYDPYGLSNVGYGNYGYNPNTEKVKQAAEALKTPLEGLISLNTPLETILGTINDLGKQDFNDATIGGQALNQALKNIVADDPQLKDLYDNMIKNGSSAQDIMVALRAAVENVGGSIENLPKMTTIEIEVLLNQKAAQEDASGLFSDIASSANAKNKSSAAKSTSGGGSGGGNNDAYNKKIQNRIDANNKIIDQIKKEDELRAKIADRERASLEYQKQKLSLQNSLKDALASGNLLAAAEARQSIQVAEKQRELDLKSNTQQDESARKIAALTAANAELEKAKKTGSATGGGTSTGGVSSTAVAKIDVKDIEKAFKKTLGLVNTNKDLLTSYSDFLKSPDVKKFDKYLRNLGATPDQIKKANKDMWASYKPTVDAIKSSKEFNIELGKVAKEFRLNLENPKEYARASIIAVNAIKDEISKSTLSTDLELKPKLTKNKIDFASSAKGKSILMQIAGGGFAEGGMVSYFGSGGGVSGPGGPKSDLIPAMLSNGEYVVRASSVSKYGVNMLNSINAGRYNVPAGAKTASHSMGGNGSINATFNISGPNADQVADKAIKKLELLMKKSGAVTRF